MVPSLAFVDIKTGDLRAQHVLPAEINMLSIRHIAADAKGEVWFGAQWQGGLESSPELIGSAGIDKPIKIFEPAEPMGTALKGYIGSVAMSRDGRILAASAPRAGRIVYIDTESGACAPRRHLPTVAVWRRSAMTYSRSRQGSARCGSKGQAGRRFRAATVGDTEFDNHLRLIR